MNKCGQSLLDSYVDQKQPGAFVDGYVWSQGRAGGKAEGTVRASPRPQDISSIRRMAATAEVMISRVGKEEEHCTAINYVILVPFGSSLDP